MGSYFLDYFSISGWLYVIAALLLIIPIDRARARALVLALVNLSLFPFLLGAEAVYVLIGVAAAWAALRTIGSGRAGHWPVVLGGLTVFGLFTYYKLAQVGRITPYPPVYHALVSVGFAYAALRLVDVGRAVAEKRHPAPDLAATINYLLPFHMISAGPIQAYDEFVAQTPLPQPIRASEALEAIERISRGLAKKYVFAILIDKIFLTSFRAEGPYLFIEIQLNFLWLYLDFSAYSDIAVGLGRLIGVSTPENFNRPYLARNVIDFWTRWHISLSEFIRHNIFTPIQLSLMRTFGVARPLLMASIAFTISFVLCGLWHQISLGWLTWGLFQAGGLIGCNIYKAVLLKRLGRKGLNRYLSNRWVHVVAVILTYEFEAFSLLFVTSGGYGNPRAIDFLIRHAAQFFQYLPLN